MARSVLFSCTQPCVRLYRRAVVEVSTEGHWEGEGEDGRKGEEERGQDTATAHAHRAGKKPEAFGDFLFSQPKAFFHAWKCQDSERGVAPERGGDQLSDDHITVRGGITAFVPLASAPKDFPM